MEIQARPKFKNCHLNIDRVASVLEFGIALLEDYSKEMYIHVKNIFNYAHESMANQKYF